MRDGDQAVGHARRALQLVGSPQPNLLDTLAAAHAEAGNFSQAVRWQEEAVRRAGDGGNADFVARLERYRQGQPYREPRPGG